ncbi:hypothetical protein MtrunA17_Chr1g0201901 [Medicago truncatula]|uniref:Transmembrane protein n=1 Tax=Medicago truncatula TaxID=3880 RepID=A0A396JVW0_MEDTR|nr:hypothetical protein MtrunA17_Chr1g0201901 [Medicago truncatula]
MFLSLAFITIISIINFVFPTCQFSVIFNLQFYFSNMSFRLPMITGTPSISHAHFAAYICVITEIAHLPYSKQNSENIKTSPPCIKHGRSSSHCFALLPLPHRYITSASINMISLSSFPLCNMFFCVYEFVPEKRFIIGGQWKRMIDARRTQ